MKKNIFFTTLIFLSALFMINGCGGGSVGGSGGSSSAGAVSSAVNSPAEYDIERSYIIENFSISDQGVLIASSHQNSQDPSFYYTAGYADSQARTADGYESGFLKYISDLRRAPAGESQKDLDPALVRYGEYVNKTTGPVAGKTILKAKAFTEGDETQFYILRNGRTPDTCAAKCYKAGVHCYVFIDTASQIPEAERAGKASAIARAFDTDNAPFTPGTGIYALNRSWFGSEWNPGVDGDPRVFILISPKLGSTLYGYFYSLDEIPASGSNQKEIIYVNDDIFAGNMYNGLATIAHEFQHLINYNMKFKTAGNFETTVINEGLSMLSEHINGFTPAAGVGYSGNGYAIRAAKRFLNAPSDFYFFMWNGGADYGAAYLFMLYIMERYGPGAVKNIAQSSSVGASNIASCAGESFSDIFRDWALVNYYSGITGAPSLPSGNTHTRYALFETKRTYTGYSTRDNSTTAEYALNGVAITGDVSRYPAQGTLVLGQYNCRYFRFLPQDGGAGRFSITYKSKSKYNTCPDFVMEQPAGVFGSRQ